MHNKSAIFCLMIGTVLINLALFFSYANWRESKEAGQQSDKIMEVIKLDGEMDISMEEYDSNHKEELGREMMTRNIDGNEYVGYLSIPELDLELPVMSQWDYSKLKIAPCRQFGATYTGNLVIAAHNYKKHFGRFQELEVGDEVDFTDMLEVQNKYQVVRIDIVEATDVDMVLKSAYELVLYTCTKGGKNRVVVYAQSV